MAFNISKSRGQRFGIIASAFVVLTLLLAVAIIAPKVIDSDAVKAKEALNIENLRINAAVQVDKNSVSLALVELALDKR